MHEHNEIQERNWGAEPWRQPKESEGETVLFSECGRIIAHVDYRSHWFKLVKPQYGGIALLVSHGGGEERISLGHCTGEAVRDACILLDPDSRYRLLHSFLGVFHDARRASRDATAKEYRTAFVEGRLHKRKMPGRDAYKITIDAPRSSSER